MSRLMAHEPIGIRPMANDEYQVFYGPVLLGVLAPKGGKLELRELARNVGFRHSGKRRRSEERDPIRDDIAAGNAPAKPGGVLPLVGPASC